MKVLDIFSGIGGFSLGLQRADFETAAFCEIEPFCRAVLAKRFPGVPIYEDVRELTAERLAADGISVIDLLCGGFPCQDISLAGKGAGLAGSRSGLFYEVIRLAEEIQPKWLFLENVSALRSRGLDEVLRQISSIGYDAEWHCIPASAIGAPHRRDRIWIVAYANGQGKHAGAVNAEMAKPSQSVANSELLGWHEAPVGRSPSSGEEEGRLLEFEGRYNPPSLVANPLSEGLEIGQGFRSSLQCSLEAAKRGGGAAVWWEAESYVGRMVDGLSPVVDGDSLASLEPTLPPATRQHRLKALGNSIVPAIAEIFGNAIMLAELSR